MNTKIGFLLLLLAGCTTILTPPQDFVMQDIKTNDYEIRTYQKILSPSEPIHIYIEGDGHAFDQYGQPTNNPTPHANTMLNIALSDTAKNVVYMARPCQYVMSDNCNQTDWTDGRFSKKIIDNMYQAIKNIANKQPIVLIGYSGGAMVSGLIIQQNTELDIKKWITIAGVLNHKQWTQYFGDQPLSKSLDLNQLPDIPQIHYVAENDTVIPMELAKKWTENQTIIIIPNATHNKFPEQTINF